MIVLVNFCIKRYFNTFLVFDDVKRNPANKRRMSQPDDDIRSYTFTLQHYVRRIVNKGTIKQLWGFLLLIQQLVCSQFVDIVLLVSTCIVTAKIHAHDHALYS